MKFECYNHYTDSYDITFVKADQIVAVEDGKKNAVLVINTSSDDSRLCVKGKSSDIVRKIERMLGSSRKQKVSDRRNSK
jgi:hypothetical protein